MRSAGPDIRASKLARAVVAVVLTLFATGPAIAEDVKPSAGIEPERLYVPPEGPMMVRIHPPRTAGVIRLVWMTPEGDVLGGPARVRPGRVDLVSVFPDLASVRRASYVQLLDHHDPVGPALVAQPMLTPLYAVTEQALGENGQPHSRIVGWTDSPSRLAQAERAAHRRAEGANNSDDHAEAGEVELRADNEQRHSDAERKVVPLEEIDRLDRAFSGIRLFVEQDVMLRTSEGEIRIALRPEIAPNTAWNFRELVIGGMYDGVGFHRIVPLTATGDPFVIQAGDPTGDGAGGPGYRIPLEPSTLEHDFGVISMARSDDPDSAGSQFFICLSREGTARLDGQYSAFGYAVNGAETILAISQAELVDVRRGRPRNPPIIHAATLVDAPPREPGEGRPDRRITLEEPQAEPRPRRVPR